MKTSDAPFWAEHADQVQQRLGSSRAGLTAKEAEIRLKACGGRKAAQHPVWRSLRELLGQFKSPTILILLVAAGISAGLGQEGDAAIIFGIILFSGFIGFWQESGAKRAVETLLAMVKVSVTVRRDGRAIEVDADHVIPGDVIVLKAGDLIPGDCLLLEAKDLFVDEGALTGESYPIEKAPGVCPAVTPISKRSNVLFMGTHVISGNALALLVLPRADTEFWKMAAHLKRRQPPTDFERGLQRLGFFLMETTLLLVLSIFALNVYFHRSVVESFLFAVALAVGLTPQLLPAVVSVNLAHGARAMARLQVIVKRLAAIENFGSMTVLCSDKTGTLTEGRVKMHGALDLHAQPSEKVLQYAVLNAVNETGFVNPLDQAIRAFGKVELGGFEKADEVPYDFVRKRLSILVAREGEHLLITKGAFPNILRCCAFAEWRGQRQDLRSVEAEILASFEKFGQDGFRVLGVAYRAMGTTGKITRDHETGMTLAGFLLFSDAPKTGIANTIASLRQLGIALKIITGDNAQVAGSLSRHLALPEPRILRGEDLSRLTDEALRHVASHTDIFAEVEPNMKERIILALRKSGHVVGYIGDGINDVSALHVADVSLSVDSAVDVAKEAADIVLLRKDLDVLISGVQEGRRTFANTLKYIFMATSATFGNMFSMAGASLFLPFLPLLPKQILLTNALTDLPEMAIPTDEVSREMVSAPLRWDLAFLRRFMFTFGFISSIFDFMAFGVLAWALHATPEQFRTGWFVESVVSAALMVLVVRSRRPVFCTRPSTTLLLSALAVAAFALLVPFLPFAVALGFVALPVSFLGAAVGITVLYMATAEGAKRVFYARERTRFLEPRGPIGG